MRLWILITSCWRFSVCALVSQIEDGSRKQHSGMWQSRIEEFCFKICILLWIEVMWTCFNLSGGVFRRLVCKLCIVNIRKILYSIIIYIFTCEGMKLNRKMFLNRIFSLLHTFHHRLLENDNDIYNFLLFLIPYFWCCFQSHRNEDI